MPSGSPSSGLADLGHRGGGVGLAEPEVGPDGARPVDEQRDRVGGHAALQRERRDREHRLAVDRERLARRGEDLARSATGRGSPRSPTPRRRGRARSCRPRGGAAGRPASRRPCRSSGASPCGVMPSTVAIAAGTDAGSPTDASSTIQTPSGNSPATSAPTSSASRVLPTPPTPVSVTSRARPHELGDLADHLLAADERAQLLREVAREGVDAAEHGEVGREPVGDHLVHRHPAAQTAEPVLAERAAAPRGRAAAPRSRRRRAPDRRARATSAARRGSPRCRSSSGRARSPHRCAGPCGPRSRRRSSSRSCSCDSIGGRGRVGRGRERGARSRHRRCRTRSRRGVRSRPARSRRGRAARRPCRSGLPPTDAWSPRCR